MTTNRDLDMAKAIEMFEAGATYTVIADELGVNKSALSTTLGAIGLHRNVRAVRRQRMAELYKQGRSTKEIASMVGLTPQYVTSEIAKMGLRKRKV